MTVRHSILCVFFIAVSACGGTRKSKTAPDGNCWGEADALIAQAPVCSPLLIAAFEKSIDRWIRTCGTDATNNDRISRALSDSKVCAKNQAQLNAQGAQCEFKVREIEKQKACEGEECRDLADALQTVAAECHPFKDNGFDLPKASALHTEISKRLENDTLVKAIAVFREKCTAALSLIQARNMEEAIAVLISASASQPKIPADATEAVALQGTESFALCESALHAAVDARFKEVSVQLNDAKVQQDVLIWMATYRISAETSTRLKEAGALNIAPGLTEEVDALLTHLEKRKNEIESAEMSQEDTISKKTLTEAAKRCTDTAMQITRLKKKVTEHTAASNERKAQAYSAKLANAEAALDLLLQRINEALRFKPFSDEKISTLLNAARAAGCPIP